MAKKKSSKKKASANTRRVAAKSVSRKKKAPAKKKAAKKPVAKTAKKKSAAKKAAPAKSAKAKTKTASTRSATAKTKRTAAEPRGETPIARQTAHFVEDQVELQHHRAGTAGQSGGLQQISREEDADSESVDELLEEGNTFEAGVVSGVEEADDNEEREVHTHEFPEDDVPEEYLDDDRP